MKIPSKLCKLLVKKASVSCKTNISPSNSFPARTEWPWHRPASSQSAAAWAPTASSPSSASSQTAGPAPCVGQRSAPCSSGGKYL